MWIRFEECTILTSGDSTNAHLSIDFLIVALVEVAIYDLFFTNFKSFDIKSFYSNLLQSYEIVKRTIAKPAILNC